MKVTHIVQKQVSTYWVKIFISGPLSVIEHHIREYCFDVGLCVTVTPTKFIYTGGEETGVEIGLINYPKYPKAPNCIWVLAIDLAKELLDISFQRSVLIMNAQDTVWISHQDKDPLTPHT